MTQSLCIFLEALTHQFLVHGLSHGFHNDLSSLYQFRLHGSLQDAVECLSTKIRQLKYGEIMTIYDKTEDSSHHANGLTW